MLDIAYEALWDGTKVTVFSRPGSDEHRLPPVPTAAFGCWEVYEVVDKLAQRGFQIPEEVRQISAGVTFPIELATDIMEEY